mgnify:CR=1 FL=1
MSPKRKHGTPTVPMTFTTRHYDVLKTKTNRSQFIDEAIAHYDATVMWHHRSKDHRDVMTAELLRCESLIKEYIHVLEGRTWIEYLESRLSAIAKVNESKNEGEEE